MSELRQNLATKEWVVIDTKRIRKSEAFKRSVPKETIPDRIATCPFCSGNEAKLPAPIESIDSNGKWKIRVYTHPDALFKAGDTDSNSRTSIYNIVPGEGRHEVIIESPSHNMPLALHPVEHIESLLKVYQTRFLESLAKLTMLVKNHGRYAGTLISHPHTEVIGCPVVAQKALWATSAEKFLKRT